jgi:RimJ/RimL family protein N-acetyltransferase
MPLLRDVVESDLPVFFEHQQDPEATAMADFPARDRDAFDAHWARILPDETLTKKTIVFEDQVAGNAVSWPQDGRQLVGYWLGREFWGKGLATRALAELIDDLGTRPLYAYVAKTNIGSIRVLEKCGFVRSDEDEDLYVLR